MISNIRFLRGTEAQWQLTANANRVIEVGEIAIEYTLNEFNEIEGSRLKIGQDLPFVATPYLFQEERNQLTNRPNEVLYRQTGNVLYITDGETETELDLFANLDINTLLEENQNVITDIELLELQKLIIAKPTIESFLLSSSINRKTGQNLLAGNYIFQINCTNKDNLHATEGGRIEVSGGNWTGLTFNLKDNTSATINLTNNLSYNQPTTLTFKIFTKDKFGVEREQTITQTIKWKAELWYGVSNVDNIISLNSLSNLLNKEFDTIDEIGMLSFNHAGIDRYDYIAIENSVSNYDIRDYYNRGMINSFGMGEGLEIQKLQDITFGNKSYSLYVTNDSSFANTKAIITNASS